MIQLCLSLLAALAVNTPVEIAERTKQLLAHFATQECSVVPAAEFLPGVRGLHIVREVNEVFVIEGTHSGISFWSWTIRDSDMGRQLLKQPGNA